MHKNDERAVWPALSPLGVLAGIIAHDVYFEEPYELGVVGEVGHSQKKNDYCPDDSKDVPGHFGLFRTPDSDLMSIS